MVGELAAIFAAYGLGVCLVHHYRDRLQWEAGCAPHAVLVTKNAGSVLEWHLRMLAFSQWVKARRMRITVVDEGSADDTLHIAERLIGRLPLCCELIQARSSEEARQWLERFAGDANEVRILREPVAGRTEQGI